MMARTLYKSLTPASIIMVLVITIGITACGNNPKRPSKYSTKNLVSKDSLEVKQIEPVSQKITYINNFKDYRNINDLIKDSVFKNNVLYIDIWSTHCGPCLIEFQNSHDLKDRYKGTSVKFIYLVDIGDSPEYYSRWDSIINKYKLNGYHMRMSDKFYNSINSINGIKFTGKPHYILVDRYGNIVFPNAERPSSKEKLYKQIDRLLL